MQVGSPLQSQTNANTTASKISSDFETFLKMLTAQISNQDPLNPIDASDYSTQLATFSGVEQQVLTNDLLRQIQNKLTATDLVSVSHWVGKQVEIPNNVGFFGEDAEIRATLPADATHGKVEVLSASGAVIASLPIHPGDQSVTWDGRKTTGEMVSYGIYSAHIIPYDGETELETGSVYSYHSVQEVSLKDGKAVLGLADGNYVYSDMVTALKI
jgi:flagellar basal-body rod modification protein FlgD